MGATLSELVHIVAAVEGLDPATVGLTARLIREAGYISSYGRGPSAAKMTTMDAANLLIAVNGSPRPAAAVEYLEKLRSLSLYSSVDLRVKKAGALPHVLQWLIAASVSPPTQQIGDLPLPERILKALREGDALISVRFERPIIGVGVEIGPAKGGMGIFLTSDSFGTPITQRSLSSGPDQSALTSFGNRTLSAVATIMT